MKNDIKSKWDFKPRLTRWPVWYTLVVEDLSRRKMIDHGDALPIFTRVQEERGATVKDIHGTISRWNEAKSE